MVKVLPKTKLKGIRKAILEELGVQDICTARLYSMTKPPPEPANQDEQQQEQKPEKEEDKEGEQEVQSAV